MPTDPPATHRTIAARARTRATRRALSTLALAGLVACAPAPAASPERAVLDAVLADVDAGKGAASVAIAPHTATMSPEWFPEVGTNAGGPDAALWHRLATLSTDAREARSLALPSRAWVLSPVLAAALDAHDVSWLAMVARLRLRLSGGTGVVGLSPVAFSADGTSALVYHEYRCGARCGRGVVTWLVRLPDGRWRVRERRALWER